MAPRLVPARIKSVLPTDVLFEILDALPPQERLKMLMLNRWFLNTFGDFVLRQSVKEGAVFYLNVSPRYTSPQLPGLRGDSPFVVQKVNATTGEALIVYPKYDGSAYSYNDIHVEGDEVVIDSAYSRGGARKQYNAERRPFERRPTARIDWYRECRAGRIRVLDGNTFRVRFMADCEVCEGKRKKCAGCGVAGSFPRAFTSCGCTIPCPLCVGYEAAVQVKERHEKQVAMSRRRR